MQTYYIVDPDWEDQMPLEVSAKDPSDAVRKFYTGTLIETPPSLYHVEADPHPGSATFGSIGETRVAQFYVTDARGQEYNIFFN